MIQAVIELVIELKYINMYSTRLQRLLLISWFVAILLLTHALSFAEQIPPNIQNTKIFSQATFSAAQSMYTYQYRIVNADTNNEIIFGFRVDVTTEGGQSTTMSDPLPQFPTFKSDTLKYLSQKGVQILPVELIPPAGWAGLNISANGTATFMSGSQATAIVPGEQLDGFKVISTFAPGIRKVHAVPGGIRRWFSFVNAKDETEEAQKIADEIRESFNYYVNTLGPVGVIQGTHAHWNQFRDDLNKSIELGWIQDATLASILIGQLASAREAFDGGVGTLTKSHLQTLIDHVIHSVDSQRKAEVRDLVLLNCQSLMRK